MDLLRNGRLFWGLVLLAGGVILLLNQLGVTDLSLWEALRRFWPVILVYFGALGAIEAAHRGLQPDRGENQGILWGTVLVNILLAVAGVLELMGMGIGLGWVWGFAAPAVLIVMGIRLMQSGVTRPGARTLWAFMGNVHLGRTDWQLADLAVVTFMGSARLDLSRVRLPESGEVWIDLYCFMGEAKIYLPEHLAFTCEGLDVMGATETGRGSGIGLVDYRVEQGGAGPRVRIRSHSIMGGCKVERP